MRTMILVTLFALGCMSIAKAADMPTRPPAPPAASDCGDKCQSFKATRPHVLTSTNIELVCIPLKQAKKGIVVIRFYGAAGNELDAGRKEHSNVKDVVDQFCVGRHFLEKAQAGHVEICNDVDTKSLAPQQIAILLASGMPPNHWVYLFKGRFRQ